MKRFVVILAIAIVVSLLGPSPSRAQMVVEEAAAAPKKDATSYHETMCNRMCLQLGKTKKTKVCGKNGKTYDNSCSARCAKVSFKRGACPEEKKKEEAPGVIALDEEAVQAQIEAEDKRPGGEVKWFDWDKGYGAIIADDGKELYVDAAAVTGDAVETLKQGDRVKFDLTQGPKGIHAVKVALELTEEEKEAKIEQAALQVVEEEKPKPVSPPKQLAREAQPSDGVYVLPR